MAIPRPIDHKLAAIRNMGDNVVSRLGIPHHCPDADARQLREALKEFADTVLDAADEIIASREIVHDDRSEIPAGPTGHGSQGAVRQAADLHH
jgi:hypothetical protein